MKNLLTYEHTLFSVNVDKMNSDGRTPLLYAAQHGHHEVVKLLLEFGVEN